VELVDQAAYNALTLCQRGHHVLDQQLLPHWQRHALSLSSARTSCQPSQRKNERLKPCQHKFLVARRANPRAVEVTVAGTHMRSINPVRVGTHRAVSGQPAGY
jgi:hypothetical protein